MPNVDVTRIAGNIGALNALNSLMYINNQLAIHQTRLATGKRLNSAADDPAGMNMAIGFDVRRNDMKTALSAIGDASNMLATAEGGLMGISDILVKMKNKVMEAAGATIGSNERDAVATQMNAYVQEIDQMVQASNWNGVNLLGAVSSSTGSAMVGLQFFVGVDGSGSAVFAPFSYTGAGSAGYTAGALGLVGSAASSIGVQSYVFGATANSTASSVWTGGYQISDLVFSGSAINTGSTTMVAGTGSATLNSLTNALATVKKGIVDIGSMSARLTFKENAMMTTYINTEAAYNRIMNADMASEQVEASKYTILQQTATAMLAQANAAPQFLLSLFR